MSYDVAVRMGVEALREVRELDAGEDGRIAVIETVDVVAPADPDLGHLSGSRRGTAEFGQRTGRCALERAGTAGC